MKRSWFVCKVRIALVTLFVTSAVLAQGVFGTISGSVADQSGAVIPNASVVITKVDTNVATTVKSNASGDYTAPNLNPGNYKVQVSSPGFKTVTQTGIVVRLDANPKVSVRLEIGGSTESVEVSEEATMLQTQESSVSTTIDERQLAQLPVLGSGGRSPYSLLALSPGVTQQTGEGGLALDNARLNGGRPRQDDYLIDGTTTQQATFGGPTVSPSVDSIQEMKVITSNFSARFGKVSGGVIELTTKSGTNQFHGSAYEFYQTNKLNALNYFAKLSSLDNTPSHYDEFGGTVGGPILKSKIFFFTDYQGIRAVTTSPVIDDIVPNAAFRSGDLSALCSAGFSAQGTCTNTSQQLYVPGSSTPYLRNQVPVSSIARALLALYPSGNAGDAPVTGGSLFNGSSQYAQNINRFNPRIDWFLNQSNHIFAVYHLQRERDPQTVAGFLDSASYTTNPADTVTAGWSHTFSPSLVNELRFGYSGRDPVRTTSGFGQASPSDFGLSAIPDCTVAGSDGKCGPPNIGITGFTGVGAGTSLLVEPAHIYQGLDNFTKVVGAHSLQFGGEIRQSSINNIQPNAVTGSFSFNGKGTGNAFGDFLIGYLATNGSVQVQRDYLRVHTFADAVYFQDDWRATRSLTLNLGLRWQYDPSWVGEPGQLASFNPYALSWTSNGENGAPAGSIETHWKEFAPRVGFAWSPFEGTAVHGGFGISYPGVFGHGRGGDGNTSPNILATTQVPAGSYLSNLPTVSVPSPGALNLGQAEYFYYTPYHQAPQYSEMWNLSVQQQFGKHVVSSIVYSGSHGVHLPVNYSYNLCQQSFANIVKYGNAIYNGNIDSPYCAPGNVKALGGFYGDYVYPGYTGISSSVFHSLQGILQAQTTHGLTLQSSITWSKLLDDSSSDFSGFNALDVFGQDFYHRSSERSISAGDIPIRLVVSPIYDLPFGRNQRWLNKGALSEVAGGFRISAIYALNSGSPVGIYDGGYQYCNPAMMIVTRPNLVGDPQLANRSRTRWFNTNAYDWSGTCAYYSNLRDDSGSPYQGQPLLSFGNTPRFSGAVRGPRYDNLDASIQKEVGIPWISDRGALRFQLDAFNALNHTLFSSPVGTASPYFGSILSTRGGGSRTVQLGAHLEF